MACKFSPRIPSGVNLPPLVKELWHTKDNRQAAKGLLHLEFQPRPKVKDEDTRALYKRMAALIYKITITGDQDKTVSQSVGSVVLIWMAQ